MDNTRQKLAVLKELKHGDCTRQGVIEYLIQVVKDYTDNNACCLQRTPISVSDYYFENKGHTFGRDITVYLCALKCLKIDISSQLIIIQ